MKGVIIFSAFPLFLSKQLLKTKPLTTLKKEKIAILNEVLEQD